MVFEKIAAMLAEKLECDAAEIKMDTEFSTLGIDSLDVMELLMNLEEELGKQLMIRGSRKITLTEDGKVTGDKTGTWKLDKSDGTGDMTITLDGVEYHGAFDRLPRDKDDRKVEMTFSVIGDNLCAWASQK